MPGDRIFNFNGANVTFNDIHDNHNCTINVPSGANPDSNAAAAMSMPSEGNYQALVLWLEDEKRAGRDHLGDAGGNRSQMCRNLSKILGWVPDPNSLGHAINRP